MTNSEKHRQAFYMMQTYAIISVGLIIVYAIVTFGALAYFISKGMV